MFKYCPGRRLQRRGCLTGSYLLFAFTKSQRNGDTQPSLQERYGTLVNYTAAATIAANNLVSQRLLPPSDAAAAIQSATNQAQRAGLL